MRGKEQSGMCSPCSRERDEPECARSKGQGNVHGRDGRGDGGNTDMLSLLISAGADVNATTTKGRTALMWAAWRGRNESAKTLIEKNAIVNAQDGFGSTALMLAAH